MNASPRRKRAVILSIVSLVLVAVAATGLYLRGKKSSMPQETAASGGKTSGGVALASTKGSSTPAADSKDDKDRKKDGEEKEKAPVPVSVTPVAKGAVSSYITSTANLIPENEVKILAEAEGRVAELLVEEGRRVGKGQVLAQLVKDDAEITLRKAQVRLENAKVNFERAEQEVKDHLISQEQFDKDRLDLQIAQQDLVEGQWRLDKTTIRAPFGGRITERFMKLGQHVRPGDQLFTVADFDPLIARIFLPEKDVYGLKEGRDVRITLKANEQTRFHGRIRQISPVVDTATGTVKLTVEANEPPADVRPGAFVTIDIVRETHAQAVLLPREAVIRELRDAYVFVASKGVAEKRTVSLGLEEGSRIEALSGVAAGEQVIVAGQGGLKQGSPIKVIASPEASDLGQVADSLTRG